MLFQLQQSFNHFSRTCLTIGLELRRLRQFATHTSVHWTAVYRSSLRRSFHGSAGYFASPSPRCAGNSPYSSAVRLGTVNSASLIHGAAMKQYKR